MNIALIRTMDSQGRIVIPAEIRKQMKLSDGDALELETMGMELLLRKCPAYLNGKEEMSSYLSVLYSVIHCGIAICSEDHILVSAGIYLPEGTPVTEELAELVADGQEQIFAENCSVYPVSNARQPVCAFFPRTAGTSSLFQNRTALIRDGIWMRQTGRCRNCKQN